MVGIKPIIFRTIARIHGLNLTPRTQERISKYLPEGILTAEGKIAGHFLPFFAQKLVQDIQGKATAAQIIEEFQKAELATAIAEGTFPEHLDLGNVYLSMVRQQGDLLTLAKSDARQQAELRDLRGQLAREQRTRAAQEAISRELVGGMNAYEAENMTVGVLFAHLGASQVKTYDVDRNSRVRASRCFVNNNGVVEKVPLDEVESHFSDWVGPQEYLNEVMGDVVLGTVRYALIKEPAKDPRCWKPGSGKERHLLESKPFALIAEEIGGEITRVYKVDWDTAKDLLAFADLAVQEVFGTLAKFKWTLALEEEKRFLAEITEVVIRKDDTKEALRIISEKIAQFFRRNGDGYTADRVTIMLDDRFTGSLLTQVIWSPGEIRDVEWYSGPEDTGIGRRIFDLGATVSLPRISDWNAGEVGWRRDAEGSLVGTVVRGENRENKVGTIVVSSFRENSFSQAEVRFLERVSDIVGPAFERIARNLEKEYLDDNFGRPAPEVRVYNKRYLKAKLDALLRLAEARSEALSVLFIDIDDFGSLNNAWNNEDVDPFLQEVFVRVAGALRDGNGEICRHGGEEIAVILPGVSGNVATEHVARRVRENVSLEFEREVFYADPGEAGRVYKLIKAGMKSFPLSGIVSVEMTEEGKTRRGETSLVVKIRKTVSIGVAEYRPGEDTVDSLISRANLAERQAKKEGKDTVVFFAEIPETQD